MTGVDTLESTETAANLQQRLRTQKTASDQERIQLLYLLQTGQATPIQTAATLTMTPAVIASLVGWHSILNALSVAGL